jgi:hypothetical protein
MTTFLKLLGSAIGAVLGFLVLVALRGMLGTLLNETSVLTIAIILGIVGLAVGTVIRSDEKENGPTGFLKANLLGVCFLSMIAVAVMVVWFAIPMLTHSVVEPLTISWPGIFSLVRGILFLGCGASTGYFLAGKLSSSPQPSA